MTLTRILKKESGRTNLKNWFRYNFPNPGLNKKPNIIVNPTLKHSSYTGEIGTAFDYLVRFNLERINKKTVISRDSWVAESGLENILVNLTYKYKFQDTKNFTIGYNKDRVVDRTEFATYLEIEFEKAKENHKKFIKDGKLTKEIIKSSIYLAKLDLTKRTPFIDSKIDNIEPEKIEELKELFTAVPWDNFKAKKYCFLNPTFGKGSALVDGADADFIIDNTLIDIKSSKNLKIVRSDLNQIIGYYLLSLIGGINGKHNPKIDRVGIYFARYGQMWDLPLSNYFSFKEYEKLANEFIQLVKDKNLELIKTDITKNKTTRPKGTYIRTVESIQDLYL